MINPYVGVDWQADDRILSVSHQHLSSAPATQSSFDAIYGTGVRHFAISRYRPSIITYPVVDGMLAYVANPGTSTEDLETIREMYTVNVAVPEDVIASPNAEHLNPKIYLDRTWYKWTSIHLNSIGSLHETGLTPSPDDGYHNVDCGDTCFGFIDSVVQKLQYADGGGVIINHPKWSLDSQHKSFDLTRQIMDCLDYDPNHVLGIDILSSGTQADYIHQSALWDEILMTGRRCWGFAQGDWDKYRGRNELIVPALTEHECLKAYRSGNFVARYTNSALRITDVSFDGTTYTVTAENASRIVVIVDGVETEFIGNTASIPIPQNSVYVRSVAYLDMDENPLETNLADDLWKDLCITQPIMINPVEHQFDPMYIESDAPEISTPVWKRRRWLWG